MIFCLCKARSNGVELTKIVAVIRFLAQKWMAHYTFCGAGHVRSILFSVRASWAQQRRYFSPQKSDPGMGIASSYTSMKRNCCSVLRAESITINVDVLQTAPAT